MKLVVIGCLCVGALAAGGCADGSGVPTSPSAGVSASALPASSPRTGDLYVTKECSQNAGLAGQFCTITSSHVDAIEVGSRVIYLTARGPAGLDSDVILEPPGPGNNRAFGHCTLIAPVRLCTFSGGTGKFTHFQATAASAPAQRHPITTNFIHPPSALPPVFLLPSMPDAPTPLRASPIGDRARGVHNGSTGQKAAV